jgi:hypothetical protein
MSNRIMGNRITDEETRGMKLRIKKYTDEVIGFVVRSASSAVMALALAAIFGAPAVHAADLVWSGLYRFEGVGIKGAELSNDRMTTYGLHHLALTPKIVAADGLTLFSRFDIMNNSTYGLNQRFGEFFGSGPGSATPTNATNSNTLATSQAAGGVAVSELYASWVQEFGQLIVGRAPLHFGLGAYINSGKGQFDKFANTRDLFGYKFVLGNLFFMPMLGKVSEGKAPGVTRPDALGDEDDVNDYIMHVQYENPDTDLALGLWYQIRMGAGSGNDTPLNYGGSLAARNDNYRTTHTGLYLFQRLGQFDMGVEAHQISGTSGLQTTVGGSRSVGINSYAFVTDFNYKPKDSAWTGNLKVGVVSGDDPTTDDSFEGMALSQNYHLGMFLMSRPMGRGDFFRTGMVRDTVVSAAGQPDVEAISNVIYAAPSFQHQWKEKLSWGGRLIWANLQKDPFNTQTAKGLGFELNLNVTYKPVDRLTWVTELGTLVPGEAWKGGTNAFDTKAPFGVTTRAAISF